MQSLLLSGISPAARSHPKDDRSPIAHYRIVVLSLALHWHWQQLVFASFLPRTVHAWFLVWSCEGSLPACGLPVFLTAAGGPEPLRYAPSRSFVGQLIAINPAHRRQRLFAATLSSGRRGLRGPAPIAN
jgi:hypothetical protein